MFVQQCIIQRSPMSANVQWTMFTRIANWLIGVAGSGERMVCKVAELKPTLVSIWHLDSWSHPHIWLQSDTKGCLGTLSHLVTIWHLKGCLGISLALYVTLVEPPRKWYIKSPESPVSSDLPDSPDWFKCRIRTVYYVLFVQALSESKKFPPTLVIIWPPP